MDISELPSLNCVVDKPKLKLRQTARKSTNSKLKLSMSCTEQSENSNNQDEVHSHTSNNLLIIMNLKVDKFLMIT